MLVLSFCWRPPERQLTPGPQATSTKHQAASHKLQAPSIKLDSWDNIGYKNLKQRRKTYGTIIPNLDRRIRRQLQKDKSFGSRDHVSLDIKVGSSKTYSNDLARVSIHMREDDAGNRTFALALDGLVVRSAVMTKDKKFWHRDPKAA